MEKVLKAFNLNKFIFTKETSKAVEFEHIISKDVVYLLPNAEMTIVLNPELVEENNELEEKSSGLRHSTALMAFPKRMHTGKDLIHYGYGFKFQSVEELNTFLAGLNEVVNTQKL
jgi:hypothetical protein